MRMNLCMPYIYTVYPHLIFMQFPFPWIRVQTNKMHRLGDPVAQLSFSNAMTLRLARQLARRGKIGKRSAGARKLFYLRDPWPVHGPSFGLVMHYRRSSHTSKTINIYRWFDDCRWFLTCQNSSKSSTNWKRLWQPFQQECFHCLVPRIQSQLTWLDLYKGKVLIMTPIGSPEHQIWSWSLRFGGQCCFASSPSSWRFPACWRSQEVILFREEAFARRYCLAFWAVKRIFLTGWFFPEWSWMLILSWRMFTTENLMHMACAMLEV